MDNLSFLTQSEAAEFLRVSVRTLERFRGNALGPKFVRMSRGGQILYTKSALESWAAARTYSSTSEADAAEARRFDPEE